MSLRVVAVLVITWLSGCAIRPLPMSSDGLVNLRADVTGAIQDVDGHFVTAKRLSGAGNQGNPMPSAVHVELAPNTTMSTVLIICSELRPLSHIVTLHSRTGGENRSYRCE